MALNILRKSNKCQSIKYRNVFELSGWPLKDFSSSQSEGAIAKSSGITLQACYFLFLISQLIIISK